MADFQSFNMTFILNISWTSSAFLSVLTNTFGFCPGPLLRRNPIWFSRTERGIKTVPVSVWSQTSCPFHSLPNSLRNSFLILDGLSYEAIKAFLFSGAQPSVTWSRPSGPNGSAFRIWFCPDVNSSFSKMEMWEVEAFLQRNSVRPSWEEFLNSNDFQ